MKVSVASPHLDCVPYLADIRDTQTYTYYKKPNSDGTAAMHVQERNALRSPLLTRATRQSLSENAKFGKAQTQRRF